MSISLPDVFRAIPGNVYFVIRILNINGRNMRFSARSQNFTSEKTVFSFFEVIFFSV